MPPDPQKKLVAFGHSGLLPKSESKLKNNESYIENAWAFM